MNILQRLETYYEGREGKHMNITTKYVTGDVVYTIHPCQVINNGQVILNEGTLRMEPNEADQEYFHADGIYIVSPYEVKSITVFCNKGSKTEIIYELSNGTKRTEQELFASFESAAEYAVTLYEQASGKYGKVAVDHGSTGVLKESVCRRLQHALKAVLTYEQLERFEEDFLIATQGLVFREA